MDNKFSMIEDHITLRRTFGKYWTVIPTREVWDKNWPNWLRKKGRSSSQMESVICKGLGRNLQISMQILWHISLGQDAAAFQAEVAAALDCVTSCLKKRLMKEQINVHWLPSSSCSPGSQWYKITLVVDCIEKLTVLLEVNQGTYSWKMLFRLCLGYDDLENNMVFLIIDAMGGLWMLWYFNDVINLPRIASVTTITEELLLMIMPSYHLVGWAGGVRGVTIIINLL